MKIFQLAALNRREDGPTRRMPSMKRKWAVAVVCFSGLLAAGLLATVTLGFIGTSISDELYAATKLVPKLKDDVLRNDARSAALTVEELQTHTSKARAAANNPLWDLAGALPWVGANFQATKEVAVSADDVARLGAGPLVSVLKSLDWTALTPDSNGMELDGLSAAKLKIVTAARAVSESSDRLDAIDEKGLLPQISDPLIDAREQLQSLRANLEIAADAATLAPDMLGAQGARNYLLLFQNNAEARASGGIPGALAVLTVDNGKLKLRSQSTAGALGAFAPPLRADPQQEAMYSTRLGKFMQDVNLTPDFPTSAALAQAMWERKQGGRLDGVISIDPVALSYLLGATGPVQSADFPAPVRDIGGLPMELTAENVVATLLSDVYSEISEPTLQDVYFAGVADEVFGAISQGTTDPKRLLESVQRGVSERRILLWSANQQEQTVVGQYQLSGSIAGPSVSPAEFGVYFNDGTGAKMDYYVKRTVQLVEECTRDEYGQMKVRVTSTNTAPRDAGTSLPEYVTGGGVFGVPAGSVQTNIVAYGPVQSNVETAFVGGKRVGFAAQRHDGRPVGAVTARLAPGQSTTVEFTFGKIVQHTEPQLSVTPTVQALKDVVMDTIPAKCVPAP